MATSRTETPDAFAERVEYFGDACWTAGHDRKFTKDVPECLSALAALLSAHARERDEARAAGVAEGEDRYVERHGSCPFKNALVEARKEMADLRARLGHDRESGKPAATPVPMENPFNVRRLTWKDEQGRRCTAICGLDEVEVVSAKIGRPVEVARLGWKPEGSAAAPGVETEEARTFRALVDELLSAEADATACSRDDPDCKTDHAGEVNAKRESVLVAYGHLLNAVEFHRNHVAMSRRRAGKALRALGNVRMLAVSRKKAIGNEAAEHLVRFCREGGVGAFPLRERSGGERSPLTREDKESP